MNITANIHNNEFIISVDNDKEYHTEGILITDVIVTRFTDFTVPKQLGKFHLSFKPFAVFIQSDRLSGT